VELCHGRLSQIGVFPSWKTGYLDCHITIVGTCCEKDGHHRGQTCFMDVERAASPWRHVFRMGGLDI